LFHLSLISNTLNFRKNLKMFQAYFFGKMKLSE